MTSHEELMFQFDSGSAADEERLQSMQDLESQRGDSFSTPRGFDDELLSLNTNVDEETLFSRSTATTLLGQTPDVTDTNAWSRGYIPREAGSSISASASVSASSSASGSASASARHHPQVDRSIVTSHVTTTLDDTNDRAPPASNRASHKFSLPNLFHSIRRINPATHHPTVDALRTDQDYRRHSLNQAMVFSNYNNYLNDCIFDDSVKSVDQERKLRLEQLADKFWLRDGSIDEEMFEESSDEEQEDHKSTRTRTRSHPQKSFL
ncbi:unnamed protein product [Kluyveromyces dobzhanskii CBS 2104]|uniref:WGS project CCBQ000000000 data, contig 00102 n=1 Tax=Kluyveromyces dobzhanskii CBS 2104 TaxID=1427455 RepID=A0A0A8L4J1_9SACH|nr:unnamed protein product [Kluyveromyces dobzhanskii CBS 2104]